MSLHSNTKIEHELLERAIKEGFNELVHRYSGLSDLSEIQFAIVKNIYGYGFVEGIAYTQARVAKLTAS